MLVMITGAKTPHELRYKPPKEGDLGYSRPRSMMYSVVISDVFDYSIMICIVLNML